MAACAPPPHRTKQRRCQMEHVHTGFRAVMPNWSMGGNRWVPTNRAGRLATPCAIGLTPGKPPSSKAFRPEVPLLLGIGWSRFGIIPGSVVAEPDPRDPTLASSLRSGGGRGQLLHRQADAAKRKPCMRPGVSDQLRCQVSRTQLRAVHPAAVPHGRMSSLEG